MKKMLLLTIALAVLAIIIWSGGKPWGVKTSVDSNDADKPVDKTSSKDLFLKDIDFSKGNYALYVRHKEFGEFMVLNEEALKENQDKLKINVSLINYFPGEGDRGFGVMLFKDKQLQQSTLAGAFTRFEIGTLAEHAVSVTQQRISGTKKIIQEKQDSLVDKDTVFLIHQSTFVPDDRAFRFRVYFPSIAVPVVREKESTGLETITVTNGIEQKTWLMEEEPRYEKVWAQKLERCIRQKAGLITDFDVSITTGTLSDAYLFAVGKDWGGELKAAKDDKILYVKDFIYYEFIAYIMASKNNAEKLLQLDYSDCISEEERRRPQLIAKMKALVKQSKQPTLDVDKSEVGLSGYKDRVTTYEELYEQEYSLMWLETEQNNQ